MLLQCAPSCRPRTKSLVWTLSHMPVFWWLLLLWSSPNQDLPILLPSLLIPAPYSSVSWWLVTSTLTLSAGITFIYSGLNSIASPQDSLFFPACNAACFVAFLSWPGAITSVSLSPSPPSRTQEFYRPYSSSPVPEIEHPIAFSVPHQSAQKLFTSLLAFTLNCWWFSDGTTASFVLNFSHCFLSMGLQKTSPARHTLLFFVKIIGCK